MDTYLDEVLEKAHADAASLRDDELAYLLSLADEKEKEKLYSNNLLFKPKKDRIQSEQRRKRNRQEGRRLSLTGNDAQRNKTLASSFVCLRVVFQDSSWKTIGIICFCKL